MRKVNADIRHDVLSGYNNSGIISSDLDCLANVESGDRQDG